MADGFFLRNSLDIIGLLHFALRIAVPVPFRYVLGLGRAKAKAKKKVVGSGVAIGERPVQ